MYTYDYLEDYGLWGVYNKKGLLVALYDHDFQAADYCNRHNKK